MKKFWVLFSLFILPLVFYLFLSKGIYKYSNLPILTNEVLNVESISNGTTTFTNHLTIVCFLGSDVQEGKASMFNLNQTIYKRYFQKPYFKITAIIPAGLEDEYKSTIEELSVFTDTKNWNFVYASPTEISAIFKSFNTPFELNENYFSKNAFIVDMESRLRGRKDDEDTFDGKLYGYDMTSVAVLKNKMKDDIDIIYYQLKKSAEKEKRSKREI
jgi:hypothetical protein